MVQWKDKTIVWNIWCYIFGQMKMKFENELCLSNVMWFIIYLFYIDTYTIYIILTWLWNKISTYFSYFVGNTTVIRTKGTTTWEDSTGKVFIIMFVVICSDLLAIVLFLSNVRTPCFSLQHIKYLEKGLNSITLF